MCRQAPQPKLPAAGNLTLHTSQPVLTCTSQHLERRTFALSLWQNSPNSFPNNKLSLRDTMTDLDDVPAPQGQLTLKLLANRQDTNLYGDIPGGWLVRHMDQAAELAAGRSEEHTSELQSRGQLVCRLLLAK